MSSNNRLDDVDICILASLQQDGRMPFNEIARRARVAPATILDRVAKLRRAGIISGYALRLGARALGYTVTALIHLRTELHENVERTVADLKAIPEVEEVHVVTGEYDLWIKVRARDSEHLQELLINQIHRVHGFVRSATEVCLTSPLERLGPILSYPPGYGPAEEESEETTED